MSQQPRPTLDYDHETYGLRWFDSPDVADVFYPLPGTSLVCLDRAAYLAEERGNTCPECDGLGIVAGALLCTPYDSPDEYEALSCLACNGAGELTEPADEPIAIDHQAIDAWLDSHSAQDYLPESED